jgi:phosphatidylserine decarboxylase
MPIASRVAAEVLRVLPRKHISHFMGRLADVDASPALVKRAIATFVRAYDVDMSEAIVPAQGFASFDAFFTRALKPGARVADGRPDVVVSPADGRVEDFGPIAPDARFRVKGFDYTVAELLGSESEAGLFAGGAFFIVYLSPRDYHRVHAPVDGRVLRARHVDGTLYPVNALGLKYVAKLFARNERVVTVQGARFGAVATVMVGAIGVGRITMSYDDRFLTNQGKVSPPVDYGTEGPALARGGELGRFHLGSTAIVLLGPGHDYRFMVDAGRHVRLGQAIVSRGSVAS